MSDSSIQRGSTPAPSGDLAVADGTSIGGDGSVQRKFHTIAGGTAIVTDGVTAFGDGTLAHPVSAASGGGTSVETLTTAGASDPMVQRTFLFPSSGEGTQYTLDDGDTDGFLKSFAVKGQGSLVVADFGPIGGGGGETTLSWSSTYGGFQLMWSAAAGSWWLVGPTLNVTVP